MLSFLGHLTAVLFKTKITRGSTISERSNKNESEVLIVVKIQTERFLYMFSLALVNYERTYLYMYNRKTFIRTDFHLEKSPFIRYRVYLAPSYTSFFSSNRENRSSKNSVINTSTPVGMTFELNHSVRP